MWQQRMVNQLMIWSLYSLPKRHLCPMFHIQIKTIYWCNGVLKILTFWMMTIYSDTLHWPGISPIFDPITDLGLITECDFYLLARSFHGTFATGAACQQRTLTPPDTWSCPTLGLASVLMLRPISPELVLFLDFWVSNITRYFCFCLLVSVLNQLSSMDNSCR